MDVHVGGGGIEWYIHGFWHVGVAYSLGAQMNSDRVLYGSKLPKRFRACCLYRLFRCAFTISTERFISLR